MGQAGRADHTVQPHLTARRRGHAELGPGKGLACGAIPLLDDNGPFRLVFEREGNGAALFDLDGLRLRIQDKSSGGAGFRHHHALSRFQPGDADFPVFICSENAVPVPDQGAVRVHDLELRVLEGDGGIDRAYLSNQKLSVRGIGKTHRDNALLPAVSQHDGFGGLDDVIAVRGVHFFQHIRAGVQPRPHGGAVLTRHFCTDHCTACAGSPAQIPQLERASGQGLPGDGIIFLANYGVFRHILKSDNFALAALDIKFLGGGFLDGETCGGFQLRHLVPAIPQQVNEKLAFGVGVEGAEAVQFARGRAVAPIPDFKLGPLDGAARYAVHLVHRQSRLFVVLEIHGVVTVGIEGDKLGVCVHEPGGRDGLLRHFIDTGQEVGKGGLALAVRPDFVNGVAVRRLHQKYRVGDGLSRVCVLLVNGEVRAYLILNGDGAGLAGE